MPKIILGGLLMGCLFSCREPYDLRHKIQIDNPTTEKITLSIDTILIELDPMTLDTILLLPGDHTLQFRDSTFSFKLDGVESHNGIKVLINPTSSDYILCQYTYARSQPHTIAEMEKELQKRMDSVHNRIPYDTIMVVDTLVSGNYKKTNNRFIHEAEYEIGLDEELPNQQKTIFQDDEVNIRKIYREKDFIPALIKEQKSPFPTPHSL